MQPFKKLGGRSEKIGVDNDERFPQGAHSVRPSQRPATDKEKGRTLCAPAGELKAGKLLSPNSSLFVYSDRSLTFRKMAHSLTLNGNAKCTRICGTLNSSRFVPSSSVTFSARNTYGA